MALLLNRFQAAEALGLSTRSVDRIPEADLPRVRIGPRRILFRPDDLAAFVERQGEAARERAAGTEAHHE